jgi:cation diffusion facilitator CzcD-associated flavoprotein CzcO
MSLEWIIIGGGIHGVHLAARLIGEAGVDASRLLIIDPEPELLARWRTCTRTTGMTHLRSPSVHNLDMDPWSLKFFAEKHGVDGPACFAPPYDRPALNFFNAHCDEVITRFGLADRHLQGRVLQCAIECDGVRVSLSDGQEIKAAQVILAMGAGDQPRWPEWASSTSPYIHHIFEQGFDAWPTSPQSVAVVGGGISAGQVALRLIKEGHHVHMISPHGLRAHQFDSEPGWVGPKFMTGFARESNMSRRREIVTSARHSGSMSPDIFRAIQRARARDMLCWHECVIDRAARMPSGLMALHAHAHKVCEVNQVLLATGFCSTRPGGKLVDDLIKSASLPCAACGYPLVDASLRWHPRVYVSGPLADLELGPAARNITGARRAGDRVVQAVRMA